MPLYTFRNKKTDEMSEVFLRLSDYDTFLSDNPHLERCHTDLPELPRKSARSDNSGAMFTRKRFSCSGHTANSRCSCGAGR